jgi:hypothetical protein
MASPSNILLDFSEQKYRKKYHEENKLSLLTESTQCTLLLLAEICKYWKWVLCSQQYLMDETSASCKRYSFTRPHRNKGGKATCSTYLFQMRRFRFAYHLKFHSLYNLTFERIIPIEICSKYWLYSTNKNQNQMLSTTYRMLQTH